ncbi:MAG: transposase [Neisseriaceae bacterium]|jgi:transposase
MSFIRYKTLNGNRYAYEVTSYWDAELKQSRSKSRYLGIVDSNTNEIKEFIKKPKQQEKFILDFGDGYFLNEFIKKSIFYPSLEKNLLSSTPELIPLIAYKIITQSAMKNCQDWLNYNILNILHKNIKLTSQRISDILKTLGQENVQRAFFADYSKTFNKINKSVIIDATSLPTNIQHPFNAIGKSDSGLHAQFKLLCVLDQQTNLPLFYRFLPGNITDITTLKTTILELRAMGIENNLALLDSGYFSEENIKDLYDNKINFISRMPNNRNIFKTNALQYSSNLESIENIHTYGERSVFIKKVKIELYGKKAYLYLVLDPVKKMKHMQELMLNYDNLSRKTKGDKTNYTKLLSIVGIIGLISSKSIPEAEILSSYYLRQSVEQVFGFLKDDLNLLPIRHRNDDTIRGYLFLQFLALVFFIKIRENVKNKYTVEKILMILRGLKCKVFENQVIPAELTKEQKQISQIYNILVPKKLGI